MPPAAPLLPHLLDAVLHLPVLMSLHFKPSDNDSTLNTNAQNPNPPSVPLTFPVTPLA